MRSDARLAAAEEREPGVAALPRRTARPRDALVARPGHCLRASRLGAEVRTTGLLQHVATEGGEIAQLRGRGGQARLRKHGHGAPYDLAGPDLIQRAEGADAHDFAVERNASQTAEPANVGDDVGVGDSEPHPVEELGPPAMNTAPAAADATASSRLFGRRYAKLRMRLQPRFASCNAAWRTAATICGYAAQRHRLPLIHSEISASEPACPSRMQATAETICPGVQ